MRGCEFIISSVLKLRLNECRIYQLHGNVPKSILRRFSVILGGSYSSVPRIMDLVLLSGQNT